MATPSPFSSQDEDLAEAYQFARLTPTEQLALRQRLAEKGAVQGIESIGRGALGLPQSPAMSREQAGMEIKQLAQKVAPGTPEFYEKAALIFRRHNMVGEAEQMEERRGKIESGKMELNPVMKAQRTREELLKQKAAGKDVDAALAAIDRVIAQLGVPPATTGGADPEFVKLLNEYEKAPLGSERQEMLKAALDAWMAGKAKTGADMTPYQKERLKIEQAKLDEAKRKTGRKEELEDADAVRALQGLIRIADNQDQTAERLLAHPGLPWITGARAGSKLGSTVASFIREKAADAQALMDTVLAQAFVQALQDLKAASRTSASGLGQLTEREGEKIQAAKAALRPQQGTEQFKRTLTAYIETLKIARKTIEGELTKAKAEVPPPPAPVRDAPPKAPKPEDAAPGAFPAPTPRRFTSTPVSK